MYTEQVCVLPSQTNIQSGEDHRLLVRAQTDAQTRVHLQASNFLSAHLAPYIHQGNGIHAYNYYFWNMTIK